MSNHIHAIGEMIRERREELGMTSRDLALKLREQGSNATPLMIEDTERAGLYLNNANCFHAIATALGFDPQELQRIGLIGATWHAFDAMIQRHNVDPRKKAALHLEVQDWLDLHVEHSRSEASFRGWNEVPDLPDLIAELERRLIQ